MANSKSSPTSDSASVSIGIFGGTFDPIHRGHLASVTSLSEHIRFDAVHWVLSARPPHKKTTQTSSKHRFEMLQLALQNHPEFVVDDCEIHRQQKSYTIDTVLEFKQRFPTARLTVIIGGDSLLNLTTWHRYKELVELANWLVLHRPGYALQAPEALHHRVVASVSELQQSDAGKIYLHENSNVDVSSTQLRAELRKAEGWQAPIVEQNLDSRVIRYIREQQLYKIPVMKPEQIKAEVVEALENLKGQDIKVIDVAGVSNFTDFMVVASGTSDTHVKALAREASDHLRKKGVKPLSEDGADVGEWVLVDFGDVVLHVMRPEVREYYDLEKLWDEDVRELVKKHREEQEA